MRALLVLAILTVAANCAAGEHTLLLKSSKVDGRNRICVYDDLGHDYVVTIPQSKLCDRYIVKEY